MTTASLAFFRFRLADKNGERRPIVGDRRRPHLEIVCNRRRLLLMNDAQFGAMIVRVSGSGSVANAPSRYFRCDIFTYISTNRNRRTEELPQLFIRLPVYTRSSSRTPKLNFNTFCCRAPSLWPK